MKNALLALIHVLALACSALAASAAKPNIVIILADDMGYGDVHALNPQSTIPTPNLDQLASAGMTFTDAHSPSAVCTPTRYGVLTGRYAWRTRLKNGVLGGYSPPLIVTGVKLEQCHIFIGVDFRFDWLCWRRSAGCDSRNRAPALLGLPRCKRSAIALTERLVSRLNRATIANFAGSLSSGGGTDPRAANPVGGVLRG